MENQNSQNQNSVATLPENGREIVSANGRYLGKRYFFGSMPAADIKATGKALGFKGRKLSRYVTEALTNEQANRAAQVAATVSALNSEGYIADTVTVKNKTADIRFTKPATGGQSKASKQAAEIEALKAELAALKAALLAGK